MELNNEQLTLIKEIKQLKQQKNAIILVHNYQRPEIYEIADFIGDSLMLSQQATKTNADIIVFCGVNFMAESAKILNPDKKVLMPALDAGCAMSDMITADKLKEKKLQYPNAKVICYVNTTAAVKAESDVCCTSSNAVKITKSIDAKQIIFVPDRNLSDYAAQHNKDKELIPWQGFCPIHHRITKDFVTKAKTEHPEAKVVAHPECREEILNVADHICSTEGMVTYCKQSNAKEFIILTECGMTERLKKDIPNKQFFATCNLCHDMKKNTLENIKKALQEEQFEVKIPEETRKKAYNALQKMLELS